MSSIVQADAPTRLSRKRATTRARIAKAARDLFAEQGYTLTSVEQIAEAAGIRRSTLYTHFRDKDEILDAAMRAYLERVTAFIAELPSPLPDRQQVASWIAGFAELAARERAPTVLLVQSGLGGDAPAATVRFGEEMIRAFAAHIPVFARAMLPTDAGRLARAWSETVLRELGWALKEHVEKSTLATERLEVAISLLHGFIHEQVQR